MDPVLHISRWADVLTVYVGVIVLGIFYLACTRLDEATTHEVRKADGVRHAENILYRFLFGAVGFFTGVLSYNASRSLPVTLLFLAIGWFALVLVAWRHYTRLRRRNGRPAGPMELKWRRWVGTPIRLALWPLKRAYHWLAASDVQ